MESIEVIRRYSPLKLAYEGDAVYEVLVRTYLMQQKEGSVNTFHKTAKEFVSAEAQSTFMELLEPHLTETERQVYLRGRNAKSHSHPKNADIIAYRRATGLECLFGFLYLSEQNERIRELFDYILACRTN